MASHIAHLLFAEESSRAAGLSLDRSSPIFVLGAQGPDIFLHSQRRKPRGIQYGGLLHRKGFAPLITELRGLGELPTVYAAGFLTHVVLDRRSHPYINYFGGWWDRRRPETRRYRHMHPFLERLIDMELLRETEGKEPRDLRFHRLVDCGEQMPRELLEAYLTALPASAASAARDEELPRRLDNAYLDALGYYRYTGEVDEAYMKEARRRERTGEISERWLSLIHPPELPYSVDVMNRENRSWCHPCDESRRRSDSFGQIWRAAVSEAADLLNALFSPITNEALRSVVGEENLNDGIYGAVPCSRSHMEPLPLRELYDAIRESYDP